MRTDAELTQLFGDLHLMQIEPSDFGSLCSRQLRRHQLDQRANAFYNSSKLWNFIFHSLKLVQDVPSCFGCPLSLTDFFLILSYITYTIDSTSVCLSLINTTQTFPEPIRIEKTSDPKVNGPLH